MSLAYRILGPLEIERDGEPLRLSAAKERTLLVQLLLQPNQALSVDRLAELVWDRDPPRSAVKLLQLYVSNLRKTLGRDEIRTVAGGYRIDVDELQLDSLGFLAALREGRSARALGRLRVARDAFAHGLSLWRGTEVAAEGVGEAAERLDESRLECLEEWLQMLVALGAHDEALPELFALRAKQPFRERTLAQLMLALYRAGRQADALEVFREARRALDEELGLEPGEELRLLERAILRQDPELLPPTPPDPPPRLPAPTTQLIGRDRERTDLRTVLQQEDVRLLSLVGAGGSGKTRLALAVAADVNDCFADGIAWAELGALSEPAFVVAAVAASLGVSERPGEPLGETLAQAIADREMLLVLDNFEQVIEAGPSLLELLGAVPRLTILVTSRRVLHVSGERVFTVQPLLPDDAVALFLARAAVDDASQELPREALADISEICLRLDGLPLAIELAAARARMLTPRQLLERLRTSVTVLAAGPRDLPARQQTLRDTLAWSVALLTDDDRARLASLSVFSGGCSLDGAEYVAGASLDQLATLVDHSLLQPDPSSDQPRFRMLETVRQYAVEQLDVRRVIELAHVAFFTELAEAADLRGPDQQRWLRRLDQERDNLRVALDHAAALDDPELELRLVSALWRFWWLRGELSEGRGRLDHALAGARVADAPPHLAARAYAGAAGIAWSQGEAGEARSLATEGLRSSAGAVDVAALSCHTVLGLLARDDGDFEQAREQLERSASMAAELGRESDVYVAKMNLGSVAFEAGDFGTAVALWEDVLLYHRERGAEEGVAIALLNLGLAAHRLGQQADAGKRFAEAETLFDRIGFREYQVHALHGLAAVAAAESQGESSARLLGRAARVLAESGSAAVPFDGSLAPDAESRARVLLGDEGFEQAFGGG